MVDLFLKHLERELEELKKEWYEKSLEFGEYIPKEVYEFRINELEEYIDSYKKRTND